MMLVSEVQEYEIWKELLLPAPLRSRGVAPSRSRIPAPQRQASSSSGAGFANFPARNSGGGGLSQNTPPRSRVAVPSAPARSRIPPDPKAKSASGLNNRA